MRLGILAKLLIFGVAIYAVSGTYRYLVATGQIPAPKALSNVPAPSHKDETKADVWAWNQATGTFGNVDAVVTWTPADQHTTGAMVRDGDFNLAAAGFSRQDDVLFRPSVTHPSLPESVIVSYVVLFFMLIGWLIIRTRVYPFDMETGNEAVPYCIMNGKEYYHD
jgi:hypothetical protein